MKKFIELNKKEINHVNGGNWKTPLFYTFIAYANILVLVGTLSFLKSSWKTCMEERNENENSIKKYGTCTGKVILKPVYISAKFISDCLGFLA